jgi:hypothetical protein
MSNIVQSILQKSVNFFVFKYGTISYSKVHILYFIN